MQTFSSCFNYLPLAGLKPPKGLHEADRRWSLLQRVARQFFNLTVPVYGIMGATLGPVTGQLVFLDDSRRKVLSGRYYVPDCEAFGHGI